MRKVFFAGLYPPPPLGAPLWLTLAGLAMGALNLACRAEIWPHTPAAASVLLVVEWVLALVLVPQGLWWAWGWLGGYTGPSWLRLLAKIAFMCGACGAAVVWLVLLVGGMARGLFWL
jgi:hypothetical protein